MPLAKNLTSLFGCAFVNTHRHRDREQKTTQHTQDNYVAKPPQEFPKAATAIGARKQEAISEVKQTKGLTTDATIVVHAPTPLHITEKPSYTRLHSVFTLGCHNYTGVISLDGIPTEELLACLDANTKISSTLLNYNEYSIEDCSKAMLFINTLIPNNSNLDNIIDNINNCFNVINDEQQLLLITSILIIITKQTLAIIVEQLKNLEESRIQENTITRNNICYNQETGLYLNIKDTENDKNLITAEAINRKSNNIVNTFSYIISDLFTEFEKIVTNYKIDLKDNSKYIAILSQICNISAVLRTPEAQVRTRDELLAIVNSIDLDSESLIKGLRNN